MTKLSILVTLIIFSSSALISNVAMAGNASKGAKHYQRHCALCHGSDGRNKLPHAANFQQREGLRQSDQQLFERIRHGKNGCPSYAGLLQEQQILDVISHLRTFGR